MAKVMNLYGHPKVLEARDGESVIIPEGESKVQDKFCVNLPPKVKILEIKQPAKKVVAAPAVAKVSIATTEIEEAPKKKKVTKEEEF